MTKLTIIIPVYKVEKYIERCARSLFEQTLNDIEYIFIDDCSPDISISLLKNVIEDYPERKPYVRILSQPLNLGLASAKKAGLENATGEYVTFCDSDDWVDSSMYKKMYDTAVVEDSDMVICGYKISDGDKVLGEFPVAPTRDPFRDLLSDSIPSFTCTKIVRKRIYTNKIEFPRGNMFEDTCLMCQIAFYCNKISVVSEPLYYYFRNESGLCNSQLSESVFLGAKENVDIVVSFLKEKGLEKKYRKEIESIECRIPRLSTHLCGEIFRKHNKKIYWRLFINKYCPFKEKLGYATKLLGIHGISRLFNS